MEMGVTTIRYRVSFWSDDETVLHLDDDGGSMTQNSILKKMDVYTFIF